MAFLSSKSALKKPLKPETKLRDVKPKPEGEEDTNIKKKKYLDHNAISNPPETGSELIWSMYTGDDLGYVYMFQGFQSVFKRMLLARPFG